MSTIVDKSELRCYIEHVHNSRHNKGGETMLKNRLKACREERGITQVELAKLSGLSRATINKIENNEEVNVNTQTIAKIAEVLRIPPSEIFIF